jgi:hypothetical protein
VSFTDPQTVQNPTTGLVAPFGWGDAVNGDLNFLRGAKAGCHLTSAVGTAAPGFLPWGTELYDVNGCHSTVTNTDRITVPTGWAGLWFVGCVLGAASDVFDASIAVNGTTGIVLSSSSAAGASEAMTGCQTIYPMAVGDYFSVYLTGVSTRSTGLTSHFFAHWLHGI